MRTHIRLPNLNNYTAGAITDECAPLQEEMNRLKKLTDYLKTGLKARLSDEDRLDPLTWQVKGDKFVATISEGTQTRLDQEKLSTFINELHAKGLIEGPPDIYSTINMTTVRFEKLPEE